MKRLVVVLMLGLTAWASGAWVIRKVSGAGGPSYLVEENCEGTGTPAGWTDSGAVDWDHTTTVLEGSESMDLNGVNQTQIAISDGSPLHAYVQFRIADATPVSTATMFGIRTAAGGALALARLNTDGTLTVFANGSDSAKTTGTLADNTTYHVWLTWTASGTCSVAFSTDGTEPTSGSNYTSKTGGTGAAGLLRIGLTSLGVDAVFDRILLDDVAIGDNP